MRGVLWIDDPAYFFFNDSKSNDGYFVWGIIWGLGFMVKAKTFKQDNIVWRSHFGGLQCLHAMGKGKGEHPEAARNEIMSWMKILYCLATRQGIGADQQLSTTELAPFFQKFNPPKASDTLRKLILISTPSYNKVIIERRALGIMLHIIQNSYVVGHCRRKLLNPQGMKIITVKPALSKNFQTRFFSPYADFGVIHSFHSYSCQGEKNYGWYDSNSSKTELNHANVNTFSNIPGPRLAIEKYGMLTSHWQQNINWIVVDKWLREDVFAVSQHATAMIPRLMKL